MLEQPGNPKRAWLGSPDGAVDSCVPPDIRAASLSSGRKGSSLTSKPITAALITFQLAKIPVGWWAGQKWRGRDRAGGNIEPALQRETHPNPEAPLVPLAIVRIPGKRRPKDSLLDEKSLMLRTPAMLPAPGARSYFPSSSLLSQSTHFYASQDGNQSFPWALGPRLNLTAPAKARRVFSWCRSDPCLSLPCLPWQGQQISARNIHCLIYTSSPFRSSSSINKTFYREVISGSVTSLSQSILTQPSDVAASQQSLSHKGLGQASPNPSSLQG